MSESVVLVPVYNEERHIEKLLECIRAVYKDDIIFYDDGSRDCSPCLLQSMEGPGIRVIRHPENRGYGATLIGGFAEAIKSGYKYLVTMDSDGQHKPEWIPKFLAEISSWDVVSGSRYLEELKENGTAPSDRRAINGKVTEIVNQVTGYKLTDAFCGFKAYKVEALKLLDLNDTGYAMPLQFWIQAAAKHLRVTELPVSRIYDDPNRKFGGGLDDPEVRLTLYLKVIEEERKRWAL